MPDKSSKNSESVTRVSTLSLFFDLVFVFAITRVLHLFGEGHIGLVPVHGKVHSQGVT
jgi:low temperature requirement protein LtrA